MKKFYFLISLLLLIDQTSFAQIKFQKTYGGPNGEVAYNIQKTTDGGYVMGGITYSASTLSMDMYVVKTDSIGNIQWTKSYGDSTSEQLFSIRQTTDGGYVLAGYTRSGGATENACLIKTDSNGDTLWTRSYTDSIYSRCFSVEQTADSGYILACQIYLNGNMKPLLIKTDENGNPMWHSCFGLGVEEGVFSVKQTFDGGFIAVGYTYDGTMPSNTDLCLIKTDSVGTLLWSKVYGDTANEDGISVEQTSDSGYIITGKTESFGAGSYDVFVIRTNAAGDTLWTKTYGGTNYDAGNEIHQTSDGNFIVAASTQSFTAIYRDAYFLKINPNGDIIWSRTYSRSDYDDAHSVQQNNDGSYILCGSTVTMGDEEIYFVKTDSIGNSGCSQFIPATIINNTSTIVTNPQATPYFPDLDVHYSPMILDTVGTEKEICLSMSSDEISAWGNSISIYPNPVQDYFSISFSKIINNGRVEVLNVLGEIIYENHFSDKTETEVQVSEAAYGIYLVRVFDGNKFFVKKIVIE